jgi:2-octaprenyl-6-methoxyphenol hydroxylase
VKRARATSNLALLTSTNITSTERDAYGVTVTLANGELYKAALLVAADGKRSRIRAEAGIKTVETGYNQTALVCTIEHSLPHAGLALERFLPAGPFAALPMKGNRSAIVWSETPEHAKHMLALSPAAFDAEIASRLGDYLGSVHATGKRFSYPLFLVLAKSYIATRLALVGDAAHGIHPIAGQGVNVGFRDVAVLAELIEDAIKLGMDIGSDSLLEHYQQWRRFDVVAMSAVTDGITRLFSNDITPIRAGRRTGLRIVNNIRPMKRLFMRHAMGLLGDLPRLMQEKIV